MSAPAGAVNVWTCDECGSLLVAVHTDEGTTPMFLACRVESCTGRAVSAGYPPPPVPRHIIDRIGWEWRKPSNSELKRWKRQRDPMFEHCRQGGLVLKPLPQEAGE